MVFIGLKNIIKLFLITFRRQNIFKKYQDMIQELYEKVSKEEYLSRINYLFIKEICNILNINTKVSWSYEYMPLSEGKTKRLVDICKLSGANSYVSGPAAKSYLDENLFNNEGIDVSYIDYSDYREYHQGFGKFTHNVTVLDLIFNEGPNEMKYMKMGS